jgi:riboflavin biosynthesis pyrimidine reductase
VSEPVSDTALESAYLEDERTPPWLFANMVTTIDGATAIEGRSSSIGDEQDTVVFRALRASADLIVVAAATARAEGYKKPQLPDRLVAWRRSRQMSDLPRIALVSTSLDFDLEAFEDAPPVVITSESSPIGRRRRLGSLTDVLVCGSDRVELGPAVTELRDSGYGRLLSEGGPTLNGQLAAAGLVDEWCVTVAPLVVAGDSKRIVSGPPIPQGEHRLRLDRALAGTTSLFTRWVRDAQA